jgi:hypothetical protein
LPGTVPLLPPPLPDYGPSSIYKTVFLTKLTSIGKFNIFSNYSAFSIQHEKFLLGFEKKQLKQDVLNAVDEGPG